MAEIILKLEELQGKLERLSKALENKTPLLRRIANTLQNVTEESFDKQASPFGEKWKPSILNCLCVDKKHRMSEYLNK